MSIKLKKNLNTIYIFASLCSIALIVAYGVIKLYDTTSYIDAWDSLHNGQLDSFRTPVYPVFLHILSVIFGQEHFLFATVCIQHLIFLGSLYYFHELIARFCTSMNSVFWITLTYAVIPAISIWNNCIMTESLALSGTVFLLHITFKAVDAPSFSNTVLMTVLLILMLFLRPIFIYFIPVYFAFFLLLLFNKREFRKSSLFIGASILITGVVFLSYMYEFKKENGVFSTSYVSILNKYCIARSNGLINPQSIKDSSLKADVETFFLQNGENNVDESSIWKEALQLFREYSLVTLRDNLNEAVSSRPYDTLLLIRKQIVYSAQQSLFYNVEGRIYRWFQVFGIYLSTLYLFLTLFAVYIVTWIIIHKRLPLKTILLFMLGISNIIVAVIGAHSQWGRLIFPSMPIWFILFSQVLQIAKFKPISSVSLH